MKFINIFKANGYNSKFEFVRRMQLGNTHNKVTFNDVARTYTRNAFIGEDGSIWVKLNGEYSVLDDNNVVKRFVYGR